MPSKKEVKKAPPKKEAAKPDPLFQATPRNFRVGGDIQPTRDLSRFVKWPRYVRLQRQKKILQTRLKVPPSINQFNRSLRRDQLNELKGLLNKYKPLTKKQKAEELKKEAKTDNGPAV